MKPLETPLAQSAGSSLRRKVASVCREILHFATASPGTGCSQAHRAVPIHRGQINRAKPYSKEAPHQLFDIAWKVG